ncbi:hypothetical protein C8F01DRAFT_1079114 [Mycena amicta]|nr:hypothetical protein C8F01DRAFT_1079114 [Mycena amicta]
MSFPHPPALKDSICRSQRRQRLSQRRFRLEPLNPGWRHAPPSATRTPMTNLFLGLRKDSEEIVGLIGNNSFPHRPLHISSYSTPRQLVHALKLTKATRLFVDVSLLANVLAAIEDPDVPAW